MFSKWAWPDVARNHATDGDNDVTGETRALERTKVRRTKGLEFVQRLREPSTDARNFASEIKRLQIRMGSNSRTEELTFDWGNSLAKVTDKG